MYTSVLHHEPSCSETASNLLPPNVIPLIEDHDPHVGLIRNQTEFCAARLGARLLVKYIS